MGAEAIGTVASEREVRDVYGSWGPAAACARGRAWPSLPGMHGRTIILWLMLAGCGDAASTAGTTTVATSGGTSSGDATTPTPTTGHAGTTGGATGSGTAAASSSASTTAVAATGDDPGSTGLVDTGEPAGTSTTGDAGSTTGTTGTDSGTDSGGESSTGAPACPQNGPPPGPALHRFDVATLNCPGDSCPADQDQCLCPVDFAALDVAPAHFMATGTDNNKQLVWAAGNFQAMYVDDLNTDWMAGGAARADALIASAASNFDCGAPEWFIVNEISASQWPNNPAYRQFVIEFAATMKNSYQKTVVIAAPFDKPGNHAADWATLADHAYVAAEVYLSGKEVNASGNSVAWCTAQYKAAVAAYAALGVPKDRLFLVEHFGQTTPDKAWGRAGVSVAGWHNAIKARSQAAHSVGFAGFISYAWSWNLMHETAANRLAFSETFAAQQLP